MEIVFSGLARELAAHFWDADREQYRSLADTVVAQVLLEVACKAALVGMVVGILLMAVFAR